MLEKFKIFLQKLQKLEWIVLTDSMVSYVNF